MSIRKRLSNRFSFEKKQGISFSDSDPKAVSVVQQQFAKEADVNNIMARYNKTGVLVDPLLVSSRTPSFGDFSNVGDYHTAMNRKVEVDNFFNALPAALRARFNHNPGEMLAFINDDKNIDEAIKLGLLPKKPFVPPVPDNKPGVTPPVPGSPVPGSGSPTS